MRVLLQWTQRNPRDWVAIDSAAWAALPDLGVPAEGQVGGENDVPGWVHSLNCQGVSFVGDHYAVEHLPDGCRVTVWWDDLDSYPDGQWYARRWTFLPLAPDPRFGGAINTRQSQVVYAQPEAMALFDAAGPVENTEYRPWGEFVLPPSLAVRHGIWVTDGLNLAHERAQSPHGWREWAA